jgi:hypothetical protein
LIIILVNLSLPPNLRLKKNNQIPLAIINTKKIIDIDIIVEKVLNETIFKEKEIYINNDKNLIIRSYLLFINVGIFIIYHR